jgi:hypothetical protein
MSMTRKEFLGTLIGAGALLAAGCGGDDGGGGTADAPVSGKSCTMNGTTTSIEANHGHVIMVSKDDVTAGVDKTYDITGTSTHSHMVTVTAANFTTLKDNPGMTVMVTSTVGGAHTHAVTIMCA